VCFLVFGEFSHEFINMGTEDSVLVGIWVIFPFLGFLVLLRSVELSGAVWNMDSTIAGTLECGEDSVSDRVADHTHIQNGLEWSLSILERLSFG